MWFNPVDVTLDHLAEVVFVRFLRSKVILPLSFPRTAFYKEVSVHSLHLESELCFTSLREEYLHKLLGILLKEIFVSSHLLIYSLINLYQYELNDTYFIL